MAMVRKQIYLTQELDDKVKRLAAEWEVAEAEVIRKALESLSEYRIGGAGQQSAVRETATLAYGAKTMDKNDSENLRQRVRDRLDSGAGMRFLEIARRRAVELTGTDSGGRTWTREDLYDERPKYLSR